MIKRVKGVEFGAFLENNLQLIKYDEISKIIDEQERQKADSVIMSQINEILANLDINS